LNKTTIRCKTNAPLFMAGADPKNTPEIRIPGIKGVMRFFWRAIQRSTDCKDLRLREGKLFGNAFGGKQTRQSQMRMRIANIKKNDGAETPVSHRELAEYKQESLDKKGKAANPLPTQAIKAGATFDVVITSFCDAKTHEQFARLFVVTCLLGGFGRRSRKGYGTIEVCGIDGDGSGIDCSWNGLAANLNELSPDEVSYSMSEDSMEIVAVSANPDDYPYLENIRLIDKPANDTKPIFKQIGMAVHHHSRKGFLGAAVPRLASPTILSTISQGDTYRCIITQLHCTANFSESERQAFYKELNERSAKW
jgi:CRISPR-associated protein Cmr1